MFRVFYSIMILSALNVLGDDVIVGEWKTTGNVRKKFSTAIGVLYEFNPIKELSFIYFLDYSAKPHHSQCVCTQCKPQEIKSGVLQFELEKYTQKDVDQYRYVAIEFKIRIFPALSRASSAETKFTITHSAKDNIDNHYKDLNGIFLHNPWDFSMVSYITPNVNIFSNLTLNSGTWLLPKFEPIALRVVFDRHNEQKILYYLNDMELELAEHIYRLEINDDKILKIHNIGFFPVIENTTSRSKYIELSSPVVRLYNDKKEAEKLPPLKFASYPYQNYLSMAKIEQYKSTEEIYKKVKREANPDLQYAIALSMLYGEERYHNPALAVKWLLDLARKDNHVLAYRELAVCYAYGYGVEPNRQKASIYFNKAEDLGCREAKYQKLNFLKWHSKWLWDDYQVSQNVIISHPEKREHEETFYLFQHNITYDSRLTKAKRIILSDAVRNPKIAMLARSKYNMNFYREDSNNQKITLCDDLIQQGYYAIYTNRWGRTKSASPSTALADLRNGSKHGDPVAIFEELLYDVLNSRATAERFSLTLELRLRRNISYWLAKLIFMNRDNPQVNCAINDGILDYTKWEKYDTPLNKLLIWLALNHETIDYGVALPLWRERSDVVEFKDSSIYWNDKYLSVAVNAKLPIALYFKGFVEIYKNRHSSKEEIWHKNYWKQAAELGCIAAKYESILSAIESGYYQPLLVLKDLEDFLKIGYPESYYLAGKVMLFFGKPKEAEQYFRQAIAAGYYPAWQILAIEAQKKKATQADSIKYWYNYITENRKALAHDRRSSFTFNIYEELYQYKHTDN